MAPTPIIKAKHKAKKKYSDAAVKQALDEIGQGMSVYKASQIYGVPQTTLKDKKKQKDIFKTSGKPPILTAEEEKLIVNWIHFLGNAGFPVPREQLIHSVSTLTKNLNRPNPFRDGRPGKHWYQGFLRRNKDVSCRIAQNLTSSRAGVTEEAIRNWFEKVDGYFVTQGITEVLEQPSRIYNCDETAFFYRRRKNRS